MYTRFRLVTSDILVLKLILVLVFYYRAMHFSANARSRDRTSSVCPSVRPSVTLVDCDHIG